MQHNLSTTDLVQQLRKAGLKPSDRMIAAILERGDEAIEPLLALALDTGSLFEAEPASLAPVHALRLLGEFQAGEAAETILRRLPLTVEDQQTQGAFLWAQEAPQIVARFGAAAMPALLRIADDMDAPPRQRGAGYAALSYMAVTTPELRDQIVDELRQRFGGETNPTAKGYLVGAIAQLKVRDAYPEIMEAFRNKTVDREIISAADARQMLLGNEVQPQLNCALHTLDERYQQHGPYSEEQQRAMAEMARNSGY
ncbi:MAG TPA: hypothetical protein VGD58_23185 [Herpetosiphonaceae bacterium]